MKKKIAWIAYITLFAVAAFGTAKVKPTFFKPAAPLLENLRTVTRDTKAPAIPVIVPIRNYQQEPGSEYISVNDLFFYHGDTRVNMSALKQSNLEKYLGKPRSIKKGYSEVDDESMVTYLYAGGELIFVNKMSSYYMKIKSPDWSFGIKGKNGKITKFRLGNGLAQLKKRFPFDCQNLIENDYVRLGIKMFLGILSDSAFVFVVNKSTNTIMSMSLN